MYESRLLSRKARRIAHASRLALRKEICFWAVYGSLLELALCGGGDKAAAAHLKEQDSNCIHRHWKAVHC